MDSRQLHTSGLGHFHPSRAAMLTGTSSHAPDMNHFHPERAQMLVNDSNDAETTPWNLEPKPVSKPRVNLIPLGKRRALSQQLPPPPELGHYPNPQQNLSKPLCHEDNSNNDPIMRYQPVSLRMDLAEKNLAGLKRNIVSLQNATEKGRLLTALNEASKQIMHLRYDTAIRFGSDLQRDTNLAIEEAHIVMKTTLSRLLQAWDNGTSSIKGIQPEMPPPPVQTHEQRQMAPMEEELMKIKIEPVEDERRIDTVMSVADDTPSSEASDVAAVRQDNPFDRQGRQFEVPFFVDSSPDLTIQNRIACLGPCEPKNWFLGGMAGHNNPGSEEYSMSDRENLAASREAEIIDFFWM